jgi:predicted transposase/invertase (TIGR01784 family)
MSNYIRFDWAIKRLLRQKANFVVLEGLLTVLLREKIKIVSLLESESNQDDSDDKFNRVDMLAENSSGELIVIEVQNSREVAFFHRMIYGTSRVICDRMTLGSNYSEVRKVYSISIVYFELGHGRDYIYWGRTEFRSLHHPEEILQLSKSQKKQFEKEAVADIFPEYCLLRIENFDDTAVTPLNEWMDFLKSSRIREDTTAPGLQEARTILSEINMNEKERAAYRRYFDNVRHQRSLMETQRIEGLEEGEAKGLAKGLAKGMAKGLAKGRIEGEAAGEVKGIAKGIVEGEQKKAASVAREAVSMGLSIEDASKLSGLTAEQIKNLT